MSVHRCPSCRCEFPPNPEALLEDELRDVIAREVARFENPVVRLATIARGVAPLLESKRRPGRRSVAEALRRLGFTSRATRVAPWNGGEPTKAWCADWTGERGSRDLYEPDAAAA